MKDMHDDIAAVNHNGASNELGRGTNCLYCTTAYEMRRRGYDVQAQQDWVGGIRGDMPAAMFDGAKNETIFDISDIPFNSSERLSSSASATQKVIDTVEAQGDGARGYIGVQWADDVGAGGHSMAYEVVDGKMHLIDCQTGEDFTGEDIWLERLAYANTCVVTRVDNCEFNKQMVDRYVEDVGTEDSDDLMDEVFDQLFDRLKKKKRKKKKKNSKSVRKQVNRYEQKASSVWKNTNYKTSKKVKDFVASVKGAI